jgi:hypothetical protein
MKLSPKKVATLWDVAHISDKDNIKLVKLVVSSHVLNRQ